MTLELFGVFYNRENELNGLNKVKGLMFSVLQAIQKIKNREAGTIKKNMFADIERDYIAFEMIDLKYSTKKLDENKLIDMEEEFYELNKTTNDLKPVRVSLVKKIADPELDETIFRLTIVNLLTPLSIPLLSALIPTYPLLQAILLLVFFGSHLIYNVVSSEYIFQIMPIKKKLLWAIYGVNLFLLVIVATLAFDNLKPFIALSTLKFLSRLYMIFNIIYWALNLTFIGIKFKEYALMNLKMEEEGFAVEKSEEIEHLVKQSLSISGNNESKISNLAHRLKNKQ